MVFFMGIPPRRGFVSLSPPPLDAAAGDKVSMRRIPEKKRSAGEEISGKGAASGKLPEGKRFALAILWIFHKEGARWLSAQNSKLIFIRIVNLQFSHKVV
jgi:hypothetical protein